MHRHKELRKQSKKFRRKRIRQKNAQAALLKPVRKDAQYLTILAEQKLLELYMEEKEEQIHQDNHRKWLQADKECEEIFRGKQKIAQDLEYIRLAKETSLNAKKEVIALENQKNLEYHRNIAEQKILNKELLLNGVAAYIDGSGELPKEISRFLETNPKKELCSFFSKTGCCRFGDCCIKNHIRPGVSNVLVIFNFFKHISLDQNKTTEYGNDFHLEIEDKEMNEAYVEFYHDVLPEFEMIGKVIQFLVCFNHIQHLKGNVFIEFENEREAVKAFQIMQSRFYGGKPLSVDFALISSWRAAICGLALRNKCPKGRNCNFLHIFNTPKNRFPIIDDKSVTKSTRNCSTHESWDQDRNSERSVRWRWSESPEKEDLRERSHHATSSKTHSTRHRSKRRSKSKERIRRNSKGYHEHKRK